MEVIRKEPRVTMARLYRGVRVDPISAPLTGVRDVNLVTEHLAIRNTALSDTNGTIIPGRRIQKHAMVVEGTWGIKVVGRVDDESVINADGDGRRAGS